MENWWRAWGREQECIRTHQQATGGAPESGIHRTIGWEEEVGTHRPIGGEEVVDMHQPRGLEVGSRVRDGKATGGRRKVWGQQEGGIEEHPAQTDVGAFPASR